MYYARVVQYKLGIGQRDIAEKLTKEFDKKSRKLVGFRGSVYFFDDPSGEYRSLSYWDTKEEAEEAHKKLFPELVGKLQSITKEKPIVKFYEVFEATDDEDLMASHIKI
ncbi:hypothetical protein COJ85_32155 [Bacillus sp. AFS076308]|uniref:hypothetical protein n=1 Tax=unclassified Bacillus (in: firmicutes) TaxID=185979 RepID=UPI000BF7E036|nr:MULTISPECIES: hypothetical protein [unclassified Bacillus (in: firmicutes)]PFN77622.1 hypothetical protein COJ85_32155 [Bacillus sp. AFS076308]PGV45297.1 hypothetical protein COD92_30765 [Bacillus sp. AFS037270]